MLFWVMNQPLMGHVCCYSVIYHCHTGDITEDTRVLQNLQVSYKYNKCRQPVLSKFPQAPNNTGRIEIHKQIPA